MRLLLAAVPAVSLAQLLPGYSSSCDDTTGQLHINIPYDNPTTAELLSFESGSCTGSGASGAHHSYAHDAATSTATLSLDIAACGLSAALYNTPYTVRNGQYYMATANVTLGANDNGNDLIFYNAVVGAECGAQLDYTVTFNYTQQIVTADQTGCQTGPNGECVLPAYAVYDFTLSEYTDSSFNTPSDASNRQTQANEMIYLRLAALNLPANKKFAIKTCRFVDDAVTYPMFDPSTGVCDNRYIDLEWSYQNSANDAFIAHRLFLLAQGDQDSYQLSCDVKVCDRNDHSSDCNTWAACQDTAAQLAYVCDSHTCPAGDLCEVTAASHANCYQYTCGCANGVDDPNCPTTGNQCESCNSGYSLSGGQCSLTGVNTSNRLCVSVTLGDGADSAFRFFINDGDSNVVDFSRGSRSSGSTYTECSDIIGSKTTADIQSVAVEQYETTDGIIVRKLEISYDGGQGVTYGLNDSYGWWLDGNDCPQQGIPCCENMATCTLSQGPYDMRFATAPDASVNVD
jgi:hypothetical protein